MIKQENQQYTYEEFVEETADAVRSYMGEGCKIVVQKVRKNNGVLLTGISVFTKGSNISPTVYLEEFYEKYQQGISLGDIVRELIRCHETHICKNDLDISFYTDYEKVKPRLSCRLIHREKNRELLKEVPYQPYLNLAVVCFCQVSGDEIGNGTILVRKCHLNLWKIDKEKLFRHARKNMQRLFPARIYSMEELLVDAQPLPTPREDAIPMMYVLTNEQKLFGAASILYEGVLKELSDKVGGSMAILPSSVHEVIAVPVSDRADAASLEEMVQEINATQVQPEEVLSDRVYYYDHKKQKLELAVLEDKGGGNIY